LGRKGHVIRKTNTPERYQEAIELRDEWERVRDDLTLLHEAQVRWAHDQAVSLAEYFAKRCNAQEVPSEWPVINRRKYEPLRLPV
jgi:hypothetical protein